MIKSKKNILAKNSLDEYQNKLSSKYSKPLEDAETDIWKCRILSHLDEMQNIQLWYDASIFGCQNLDKQSNYFRSIFFQFKFWNDPPLLHNIYGSFQTPFGGIMT